MEAPATPRPSARQVLIALGASSALPRGAACRLAAELERWIGASPDAGEARRMGVPASALADAIALRAEAPALAARETERAARIGAEILTLAESEIADRFRMLELPPPAIYVQGTLPDGPAVALVGARRASRYGLEVAEWLGRELAAAGVAVVSGFAVGVDAAAHRGALAAPGGRTVAVLGCGLDLDYPRGHRALGRQIAARGARLSEFPCGRAPLPWQFPVRNRLIAALAEACVVVEAAPRSGSLVTARLALELGREVLAVPGRVDDELALGTNRLIADGARPALDPGDVLEALGRAAPVAPAPLPAAEPAGLDESERALWRAAGAAPGVAEALAARCEMAVERALVALLALELAGHLVRRLDGSYAALA
ncbi:MAG TPA: DNA-processing protein DprA [Thermoanaerobaculia bacterium]|jgi:DNA processing protein